MLWSYLWSLEGSWDFSGCFFLACFEHTIMGGAGREAWKFYQNKVQEERMEVWQGRWEG